MAEISEAQVLDALRQVNDPEIRRNIVELNMVRDLKIERGKISFTLALTIPECPLRDQIASAAKQAVLAVPGVEQVEVKIGSMTEEERRAIFQSKTSPTPLATQNQIEKVIAIMSGKGGVGKSMVTALLATALARNGHRVGILDADITGPSIPRLFGVRGPIMGEKLGLEPVQSRLGIKIISVNLALEEENQAVIWRGPLIAHTIQQFWRDVNWSELDELLVDLPPGTSDAALTVMQSLPISGILIVTTPQALASMVVSKAVEMANKLDTPILGIVENMSGFYADDTGRSYEIFGPSHSDEVEKLAQAPLLARLPIRSNLSSLCDEGLIETAEVPEMDAVIAALK